MPTVGRWETPPEQALSVTYSDQGSYATSASSGATFAALCEGGGSLANTAVIGPGFFGVGTGVAQSLVYLRVDDIAGSFTDYVPTPPAGATVEYEGAGPNLAWLTTMDADLPLDLENSASAGIDLDGRAYVPPFSQITSGIFYVPGATLATLTQVGSFTLTAGMTDTGPRTFHASNVPAATLTEGSPGVWFGAVLLHWANQITHVQPAGGSADASLSSFATVTGVVRYQPRRYRFVYAVLPPLRQFPRDDNLGGAPRQGKANSSTSVQGSARQGWRATYR